MTKTTNNNNTKRRRKKRTKNSCRSTAPCHQVQNKDNMKSSPRQSSKEDVFACCCKHDHQVQITITSFFGGFVCLFACFCFVLFCLEKEGDEIWLGLMSFPDVCSARPCLSRLFFWLCFACFHGNIKMEFTLSLHLASI